uniref:Ig-like domain-containing protein n=1 Tax=Maylandia zebra TaxID=106582 RepID=A0A3P9CP15_9CICH
MAVWDKNSLWAPVPLCVCSSLGAVGQTVIYPLRSTCAVRGSTATLRCTFTPLKTFKVNQTEVPPKIVRVLWCQNHRYCYTNTPSVCDSDSANIDPHQRCSDGKKNILVLTQILIFNINDCLLKLMNTLILDSSKMRIISSSDDKKLSRGETVTLLCASVCTFHQLEVTWFKDGHALSDTGPSLLLILTAEDSGSYTCALKTNMETVSEPHSLQVEAEAGWCDQFLSDFLLRQTAA